MVTNKDIGKKHVLNDKHHTANGKYSFQNKHTKHQLIGQSVSQQSQTDEISCLPHVRGHRKTLIN